MSVTDQDTLYNSPRVSIPRGPSRPKGCDQAMSSLKRRSNSSDLSGIFHGQFMGYITKIYCFFYVYIYIYLALINGTLAINGDIDHVDDIDSMENMEYHQLSWDS